MTNDAPSTFLYDLLATYIFSSEVPIQVFYSLKKIYCIPTILKENEILFFFVLCIFSVLKNIF